MTLADVRRREASVSDFETGGSGSFTERRHIGYAGKLRNSLTGFVAGVVLIAGSVSSLWVNEERAVTTSRSLHEGAGAVVSVSAGRVAPENEGRLIHVSGPLQTTAELRDPDFGVSVQAAILVRRVEMYQWREHRKTETRRSIDGGDERVTTYSYSKTWSSSPITSGRFKRASDHANPPMRYRGRTVVAQDARIGAFTPGEAVMRKLIAREALAIDDGRILAAVQERMSGQPVMVHDGALYIGADPAAPAVGDIRVTYKVARPPLATLVGRQAGSDIEPYRSRAGKTLLFARPGEVPAADVFADAQAGNRTLTWLVRLAGVAFMFIGFVMLGGPLVALGEVVPLVGSLLGGVGAIIALVMTAVIAPSVIALAWLWHRPLVSLGIAVGGVALAIASRQLAARPRPKPAMQSRRTTGPVAQAPRAKPYPQPLPRRPVVQSDGFGRPDRWR